MKPSIYMQLALNASPERVFGALTEKLSEWFAEFADISLNEKRYDFWGKFTPENPNREAGRHPLLSVESNKCLKYAWTLDGHETGVEITLTPKDDLCLLVVNQEELNPNHKVEHFTTEDFWFLSLENLRRHLKGKPPVRCDFSNPMMGDIRHEVDIDAPASAVFELLIKPEQLNRWIAHNAVVEAHVGGGYDLGWGFGPLKILELTPDQRLAYAWPEDGLETVVSWTLEESNGKTHMTLVQSGFAPDKRNGGLYAGWLNFASWVKSAAEEGASWRPPTPRLRAGLETYYSKSIAEQQTELPVAP